jgi:hypothetical protein
VWEFAILVAFLVGFARYLTKLHSTTHEEKPSPIMCEKATRAACRGATDALVDQLADKQAGASLLPVGRDAAGRAPF